MFLDRQMPNQSSPLSADPSIIPQIQSRITSEKIKILFKTAAGNIMGWKDSATRSRVKTNRETEVCRNKSVKESANDSLPLIVKTAGTIEVLGSQHFSCSREEGTRGAPKPRQVALTSSPLNLVPLSHNIPLLWHVSPPGSTQQHSFILRPQPPVELALGSST